MRIIRDKVTSELTLSDELTLHGMATENVAVADGGYLILHGMCCRDLFICSGGAAIVHGMVQGRVHVDGGELEIYGTIGGLVDPQGLAKVHLGAVVAGVRH
jgi:hypothetical protein